MSVREATECVPDLEGRFAVQGISSRTGPCMLISLPRPTSSGHHWSPGALPSHGPTETPPGASCCWPWLSHLSCRGPVCRLRVRRARQGRDVPSSVQCGASTPRFRPLSAPLSASSVLYLLARRPRPANTASRVWRGQVTFAGAQCSPVPRSQLEGRTCPHAEAGLDIRTRGAGRVGSESVRRPF